MRIALVLLLSLSCSPGRKPGHDGAANTANSGAAADARESVGGKPDARTLPLTGSEANPEGQASGSGQAQKSGLELFQQEDRDEKFAVAREELYASVFPAVRSRVPGMQLHATCKRTSCQIVARVPAELASDKSLPEVQRVPWGDRVSVVFDRSDPTQIVVRLYPVLDGQMSQLEAHRALMRRVGLSP